MKAGMRTRLDHLNDMDMKNVERFDVVDYLDTKRSSRNIFPLQCKIRTRICFFEPLLT